MFTDSDNLTPNHKKYGYKYIYSALNQIDSPTHSNYFMLNLKINTNKQKDFCNKLIVKDRIILLNPTKLSIETQYAKITSYYYDVNCIIAYAECNCDYDIFEQINKCLENHCSMTIAYKGNDIIALILN